MAKKKTEERVERPTTRYKTGMLGLDLLTISVPKIDGEFIYKKEELLADPTLITSLPKGISPFANVLFLGKTGAGKTSLSHLMASNIIKDHEGNDVPYVDEETKTESKSKIIIYQTEPGAIDKSRIRDITGFSTDEFDAIYDHRSSDICSYEHLKAYSMDIAREKTENRERYLIKKKDQYGNIVEELAPTIFLIDSVTGLRVNSMMEKDYKANIAAIDKQGSDNANIDSKNNTQRMYQLMAMALKGFVFAMRPYQEDANIIYIYLAQMKTNTKNKMTLMNGSEYYKSDYSNLPGDIKPDGIYEGMPFEMALSMCLHKDISVGSLGNTWVEDCGMPPSKESIMDKGFICSIFKSRYCASKKGTDFASVLTMGGPDTMASLIYDCRTKYGIFANKKFTFRDVDGKPIRTEDKKNKVIPLTEVYEELAEKQNSELFFNIIREYVRTTLDQIYYKPPQNFLKI